MYCKTHLMNEKCFPKYKIHYEFKRSRFVVTKNKKLRKCILDRKHLRDINSILKFAFRQGN